MKWRWLLGGAFVVVGGCSSALLVVAHTDAVDQNRESAAALEKAVSTYGSRFRDDERMLSSLPFLRPPPVATARDAGAFLASHVPVRGDAHAPSPLPEAIDKLLDKSPLNWKALSLVTEVDGVDTRWMAELGAYDCWDVFAIAPTSGVRPLSFFEMPLPDFSVARRWAQIRLLQGIHLGDLAAAGHDVDKLARLMGTTETMLGDLWAGVVLRAERGAYDHAKRNGIETGDWVPPENAVLDARDRATAAFRALADVHANAALVGDVFSSPDAVVGRCAALQEGAGMLLAIGPLTHSSLYAEAHTLMDHALHATTDTCRLTRVREAWGHPDQTAVVVGVDAFCDPEDGSCVPMSFASHLPGLDEAQVEVVALRDPTDGFRLYATGRR